MSDRAVGRPGASLKKRFMSIRARYASSQSGESADSWVCAIVLLLDVGVLLEVPVILSGSSLCSSAGSIIVYRDLNMENC
jgi:hypothetical protein